MLETNQRHARGHARPILVLSVLALLAMACLPAFAGADSSGFQYQDSPPKVTGGGAPGESDLEGGSSSTSGVGGGKDGTGKDGTGKKGKGKDGEAGGAGGGGGNGPGGSGSIGGGTPLGDSGEASEVGSSGGGSSPLPLILIAIAALAAVSIGVVLYRQRRSREGGDKAPGSSVSPEAS